MNKRLLIILFPVLIGFLIGIPINGRAQEEGFIIIDEDDKVYYSTSSYTGPIQIGERYIYSYLDYNKIYSFMSVPQELEPTIPDRYIYQYLDSNKIYSFMSVPQELKPTIPDRYIYQYLDSNKVYSFMSVPQELKPTIPDRYIYQYLDSNKVDSFYISSDMQIKAQQTIVTPGAFSKLSPPDGPVDQQTSLTLDWEDSTAPRYEYCLDTIIDDACSTTWVPTDSNSYANISGLLYGTPYEWQVRAVNSYGTTEADNGDWWTFTTAAIPGPFSKINPPIGDPGQPTSLTFEWTASDGATSYEYCYDTIDDDDCTWINVGNVTSVVVSDLSFETTYYWHVRAMNSIGTTYSDGSITAFHSFTTQASLPCPGSFGKDRPMDGASNQKTRLSLLWEVSDGAVYYEYCIDKVVNGECTQPADWENVENVTDVIVKKLKMDTTYEWQVRALNSACTTEADNGDWWTFTTKPKPSPPTKLTPVNGTTDQSTNLVLAWEADEEGASYEYCLDTTNDGACSTTWVSTEQNYSAYLRGLNPYTTYYWHVRAMSDTGYIYAEDTETEFWVFTTGKTSEETILLLPLTVK